METDREETRFPGPYEHVLHLLLFNAELDGRPVGRPLTGRDGLGAEAAPLPGFQRTETRILFPRNDRSLTSRMSSSCSAASMLTVSPSIPKTASRSAVLTLVPV